MTDTSKQDLLAEIERLQEGVTRRQADLRMVKAKVARLEQEAVRVAQGVEDFRVGMHKRMGEMRMEMEGIRAERNAVMTTLRLVFASMGDDGGDDYEV